jgi:hypothetical protein
MMPDAGRPPGIGPAWLHVAASGRQSRAASARRGETLYFDPPPAAMQSRGFHARLPANTESAALMSRRRPVADWTTDFDHLDPRWVEDPFPIWDELRQKCPIAHTERFMGVYLPTRYEDVRAIAYDTSTSPHIE